MRHAVRPNPSKTPKSLTTQMAAPVKGWSSNVSPVEAEDGTALILDNWFPEPESISLRRGFTAYATNIASDVETLMTYTSAAASKLFACAGGSIYNISSGGAVGAADLTGLANDQWQYTMFANSSSVQYLVACNGSDDVREYDGTTWSTPSITGVTSANIVSVCSHKFRLWFVESGTSDLWYMATNAISGAATKFGVGGLLRRGGYIMACATWSVDAGSGMDDLFVAWSSEGEVIIYQGTDPASGSTWALTGVYATGKPLGRRCILPVGGDLAMLTEFGVLPISELLKIDNAVANSKAITAKIKQAYAEAVHRSRDATGWQMVTHPIANMALLNVPASGSTPTCQFAFNTITGAWSRFTGMDALCWATFNNAIYFGTTAGTVFQADDGGTDDGVEIMGACLPAYSHLGPRGRLKHIKMVQPIYSTDVANTTPTVTIAVDYALPTDGDASAINDDGYFTWDVSLWDGSDLWFGYSAHMLWRGNGNIGSVISPYTTISVNDSSAGSDFKVRVTGWGVVYELGGVL